jgi:hypothetical protein
MSKVLLFVLILSATIKSFAHDTTHIHPMITKRVSDLIKNEDPGQAYYELHVENEDDSDRGLFWGKDRDLEIDYINAADGLSLLQDDNLSLYGNRSQIDVDAGITYYDNVMDGVVQEDAPLLKAVDHFYNGSNGGGLSSDNSSILGAIPSDDRAMPFFIKAINWYNGYTEEARKRAYFIFGQSLHHVEDMSSPAHIHNDPHLTILESEKDDYEGWFLPTEKRFPSSDAQIPGNKVDEYFGKIDTYMTKPINNPWQDIWGASNPNSMVSFFYNITSYTGVLDFPYTKSYQMNEDAERVVDIKAPPPSTDPTGELASMYPPCTSTVVNNCLFWKEDALDDLAHWVIVGVGDFQHQYSVSYENDWWAIELEFNPDIVVNNTNANFSGRFYIEQLAIENTKQTPLGSSQTQPAKVRSDFNNTGSTIVDNNQGANGTRRTLLEIYARNLLKPAVEYSAGFTKYWYDVANTPPYLKQVKVKQLQNGSHPDNYVYSAGWIDTTTKIKDEHVLLDNCITGDLFCEDGEVEIEHTSSRQFDLAYGNNFSLNDIRHINANQPIKLELIFNEPIKQITQIQLCDINAVCEDATPGSFVNGQPPANVVLSENDKVWEISIPVTQVVKLNGKIRLNVIAEDKNNHRDGQGGGLGSHLDTTPDTPAKRNLKYALTGSNNYPWYEKDRPTTAPNAAQEAQDNIDYSYDPGVDTNFTLLFDTANPTGSINVDVTLPLP